jgi:hypothetical protein
MDYNLGDRVRISKKYHWAKGALGTIAMPPEFAQRMVADHEPWQGHYRFVQGVRERFKFYYVIFDEPQIDADGDGPYSAGEIDAKALRLYGGETQG